jgi:hypothetical protein
LRHRSLAARTAALPGGPGAVSFLQRFSKALNAHVRFHRRVIERVFTACGDGQVAYAPWRCLDMRQRIAKRAS